MSVLSGYFVVCVLGEVRKLEQLREQLMSSSLYVTLRGGRPTPVTQPPSHLQPTTAAQ